MKHHCKARLIRVSVSATLGIREASCDDHIISQQKWFTVRSVKNKSLS